MVSEVRAPHGTSTRQLTRRRELARAFPLETHRRKLTKSKARFSTYCPVYVCFEWCLANKHCLTCEEFVADISSFCFGSGSLFRQVVIPTARYSDRSLFRQVDIPTNRSLFRQVDSPTNRSLFRQVDSPTNWQTGLIFRKVYIPTGRYSDIKNNSDERINHY